MHSSDRECILASACLHFDIAVAWRNIVVASTAHSLDTWDSSADDIGPYIEAASFEGLPPSRRSYRHHQRLLVNSAQPADGGYSSCRLGGSYGRRYRPVRRLPHLCRRRLDLCLVRLVSVYIDSKARAEPELFEGEDWAA